MEIKIRTSEEYIVEILEDDIEGVKESLYELKRSIVALGKLDKENEVYHRYCDVEDEIFNLIDIISVGKGALN